jgi:hypothetical protein
MPTPRKNESQDEFLNRCIPEVMKEKTTKSKEHAVAKCIGMYREWKDKDRYKKVNEEELKW